MDLMLAPLHPDARLALPLWIYFINSSELHQNSLFVCQNQYSGSTKVALV